MPSHKLQPVFVRTVDWRSPLYAAQSCRFLFPFSFLSSSFELHVYVKQRLIGLWTRAFITFIVKTRYDADLHFGKLSRTNIVFSSYLLN